MHKKHLDYFQCHHFSVLYLRFIFFVYEADLLCPVVYYVVLIELILCCANRADAWNS
jgi:hypothetical protein